MALTPTTYSRVSVGYVTSTKSIAGQESADSGPVLGVGGDIALWSSIKSMVVPSTTPIASSSTTVGVSNATIGDHILVAPLSSLYSGDAVKLLIQAIPSFTTPGEVDVNFSTTSDTIAVAAANWRFTRIARQA